MGLSFFNPSLNLFAGRLTLLPCHPVVPNMLVFYLYLPSLFWACYMLSFYSIPVAQYYHWACTHVVLGFLGPFYHLRAPLGHFVLLDILGSFHFFRHPRPIPILHSHGLLLIFLGFPSPSYHIFYFQGL